MAAASTGAEVVEADGPATPPPNAQRARWHPAEEGNVGELVDALTPDFSTLRGFVYATTDRGKGKKTKTSSQNNTDAKKIVAKRELVKRLEKLQHNLSFTQEHAGQAMDIIADTNNAKWACTPSFYTSFKFTCHICLLT